MLSLLGSSMKAGLVALLRCLHAGKTVTFVAYDHNTRRWDRLRAGQSLRYSTGTESLRITSRQMTSSMTKEGEVELQS
jgi:hypothetical protein